MIQIIIAIAVIYFLFVIGKKIIETIGGFLILAIGALLCFALISLVVSNIGAILTILKYSMMALIVLLALGFIANATDNKKLKKWLSQNVPLISKWQVEDLINPYSDKFYNNDANSGGKFITTNIPYGRVNAFLNYHGLSIEEDEPVYYSAQRSKTDIELREYGTVVTLSGIYISKQLSEVDENNEFKVIDKAIPFKGIFVTELIGNELTVKYAKDGKIETIKINQADTTIPVKLLKDVCDKLLQTKISLAMYSDKVVSQEDYTEALNKGNSNFEKSQKEEVNKTINTMAGVMGASEAIGREMNNTKNFMNGSRGHGYGAEYANNTIDKLAGRKVVNAAQNLDENGRQVKHGADRIVNGVNIQTKYYKTASESVSAAFENKEALYVNQDGTMMQIEVPRDQYNKACELMQKRIDNGEVPGAKPGDDARKYVRKGFLTYPQSHNVCKSGSIESLTIDAINGVITSSVAGGITAVTVFAYAVWNGADVEEAAKAGLEVGIKVMGRGAVMYTLTMQLSRSEFINPFVKEYTKDGISQGFKGVNNPIFTMSENLANNISTSNIAKTQVGQKLGLNAIKGGQIIAGGVTVMVVFGPDICRALSGRISTKQLFKNASVGAAGIAGGILGQMFIPIPYVGAMVGGGISSFIAKKVLDEFIEDDAKEMFQILKEEFLDVVMISNLEKDEFDNVVNETLCNKKLPSILRDMYASGEARKFAREAFVSVAVINELSKREQVTTEMIEEGFVKLALSASDNSYALATQG